MSSRLHLKISAVQSIRHPTISATSKPLDFVEWLSPYHQEHILRYRKTDYMNLPLSDDEASSIEEAGR